MNWCLLVFLIVYSPYVQSVSTNKHHENKFGKYKKCMTNNGVSTWKVVDSASNATYYNVLNFQWNKIFEKVFPVAIFVPSSVSDVQTTVKCGFEAKIPIVPNSGGHSYAGLSLGTNDSIIVDFRNMKSINMNEKEGSVTVGPGAFVGHLHSKLWKNGGWFTPLGNCMTLGMGGHSIGGGVGYLSPLYGLVIDNIMEFKMVDAGGNAVTVNADHNSDLWWAMRGVGPGYIGLVTSVKIKMFKAKDLKLTFAQVRYRLKDFQIVLASFFKWLDWVKQNEPSLSSVIFAVNDNYNVPKQPIWPGIEVQLLHIQDPKIQPNSSSSFLDAFPKFFPKASQTVISYPSYVEFIIATGYTPVVMPASLPQPSTSSTPTNPAASANQTLARILESKLEFFSTMTKDMALPRYFFASSFYVKKQFRTEDLKEVQDVVSEIPNNTNGIMITSEQGAIATRRAEDSAYVHRNTLFNVRLFFESMNVEGVASGKMWAKKFLKSSRFIDGGETYQNYPDIELKDYLSRYYGTNLKKLIQIKRKWDPTGYFNSTMSIPIGLSRIHEPHRE